MVKHLGLASEAELTSWLSKVKKQASNGERSYNGYRDTYGRGRTLPFWIVADHPEPTPESNGMRFTVHDQIAAVSWMESRWDASRSAGDTAWYRLVEEAAAGEKTSVVFDLLSIQEVKMGSKLARLVVADRARADEVLQRGRKLSAQFNSVLKAREDGVLEEMAEILRQAEADAETAANAKRAERAAREKLAREWVHLPLESARRRSTERTLRGLVEEHIRPRAAVSARRWALR